MILRAAVCCLLVLGFPAHGQAQSTIGERAPAQLDVQRPVRLGIAADSPLWTNVPATVLEPLDTAPLLAEDARLADVPGLPTRVGVDRPARIVADPREPGGWTPEPGGGWTWRHRIHDPGALAMRVYFSVIPSHEAGTLLVADARGQSVRTVRAGVPGRTVWSSVVVGDTVLLELHLSTRPPVDQVQLVVEGTAHMYRDLLRNPAQGGHEPRGECEVDVMCRTVDPVARDAVGRMAFSSQGQQFVCSGVLLSDMDPATRIPYFLTANHCLSSQAEVDSLTVTWLWQTDACGGSAPPIGSLPSSEGGTLLATSSATDFTFIQLAGAVPPGVGLAGWTTSAADGTVTDIHHPGGGLKEFSQGTLSDEFDCDGLPDDRFYYGTWDDGIQAGGSSGSPLFNGSWQVVGQLYGRCVPSGMTAGCDNRAEWRWVYGRFDQTITQIAPFLISQGGVWVDFAYSGPEEGSMARPFNTLAEGLGAAPCGGTVILVGNRTSSQVGTVSRPPGCPVTLQSIGGPVTIGQ